MNIVSSRGGCLPLSIAIITCNEENRMHDCIGSVNFADDIVVVDSESTDGTAKIAEKMGARVFIEAWKGFGRQKQSAIDHCKNDWVLILDADERIPLETALEIKTLFPNCHNTAYSLPRKNYFWGRWIQHAGWWPDRTIRLFNRGKWRMADKLVHEALEGEGAVGQLESPIVHLTYKDMSHIVDKVNQYSTLGARELHQRGEHGSVFKAVARASWAFFYNFCIRAGFRDGKEGLILAVLDATNIFIKYIKLIELQTR